ncbi:hypothetical protein V0R52_12655 [Pseudomonas asiatica]|uniref:hypothetical protein n=1 Tax=Pseudomonas TaxID=286 RepID=UPI0025571453|nr:MULTISPECIES: hypothetical protein [Pseudomonas]MDM9552985.1 hypothetical protein [Pseudomonas asiatica]MEE1917247.1 hypothetical protein [Pseudomonas asiatica]WIV23062.1 hypothetical protein QN085_20660 [Pseudomonas sp. M2(2023)]
MSPKLNLIARQVHRREEAPAPVPEASGGVGNAIEQMIAAEVDRRVGEALAEQRRQLEASRPPAPTYTDFKQIPPVPQTRARKAMQGTVQRDGAGVARAMVINGKRLLLQRDAAGQLVGFVDEEQASEVNYNGLPPVPADFNRPRKLYGNDGAV